MQDATHGLQQELHLVVELTDEATLTTMWDSADAMPSLPEIEEPRLWLARSA